MRGKVAIVVPMLDCLQYGDDKRMEFIKSVEAQNFDPRWLTVVPVVRTSALIANFDHLLWGDHSFVHCIPYYVEDKDAPRSQMEQCDAGFSWLEEADVEFVVVATTGDCLEPTFIRDLRFALTADDRTMVSIPDLAYCDEDMSNPEIVRMDDKHTLGKMVNNNMVPDCSMFRMSMYRELPFSSQYGRSSFWIWWIKVFQKFGPNAFVNVHKPLYRYRYHPDTASSFDEEWVSKGYERFSEWARAEGLIPETGSIKPFPKEVWHPKVKKS